MKPENVTDTDDVDIIFQSFSIQAICVLNNQTAFKLVKDLYTAAFSIFEAERNCLF